MVITVKYLVKVRIDEIFSLKQKRSEINRLKTAVKRFYDSCVIESNFQDSLKYICLAIAFFCTSPDEVNSITEKISVLIENTCEGIIEEEYVDYI